MASKGNKAGKLVVWLLLAMLIVGLAGFGIGSFGGGATAIGAVGDRKIPAEAYFRALTQALRSEQQRTGAVLTLPEAEARGLTAQVRGQLAGIAALDNEAARLGLSVGDLRVAEQIRRQSGFAGPTGQFDRTTYEFTLRQNGWSVAEFERDVRAESARLLLQDAVGSGVTTPAAWVDQVMAYYGERRSLRWVRFGPDSLAETPAAPDDAAVEAWYAANPAAFTLPERKRITYAWIRPEDTVADVTVDEAALKQLYQDRIADYVQPERRLVERLVFPDAEAAVAAKSAIEAGETDFVTLVEARGLSLEDIDLGEVSAADLGDAGAAVFALAEPGVVGPFPTSLGPALFRMNGILSANEITYDAARTELIEEYSLDAARRGIADRIGAFEDDLAAGATLEDLAAETGMTLGTVDFEASVSEGIAGYTAFRAAAAALTLDDFPRVDLLEDGSAYAMRLDEIVPPSLQPLDAVRDAAAQGAADAALRAALTARATDAQTTLQATQAIESTGPVEAATLITRDALPDAAPPEVVTQGFALAQGESAVVPGPDAVYLVELTDIQGPDPEDPRTIALRAALDARVSQGISGDLIQLYAQALTASAGITFNDAALNTVNTQVFR